MNKIDKLIEELCPEGVSWGVIGEHIDYEQPTKYIVASTDYSDSNPTPVLTAGQTFILGHTDETFGIYEASTVNPVIIFDDFTTAFKWVDFPFKVKSSAMKLLTPSKKSDLSLRFLFHYMGVIGFSATEHARHWISIYSHMEIPIPPLPLQQEIARILDKFTELEAELEAELGVRREQYGQYRNKLFSAHLPTDVKSRPLREVTDLKRGSSITKSQTEFGEVPVIAGGQTPAYFHNASNRTGETIVVAGSGAYAGFVSYWNVPIYVSDAFTVTPKDSNLISRYLFHFLLSKQSELHAMKQGSGVPHVYLKDVGKLQIPLPSTTIQREIVSILDKFSELETKLEAELEARRRQYEYYRNKLLTFKELKAS